MPQRRHSLLLLVALLLPAVLLACDGAAEDDGVPRHTLNLEITNQSWEIEDAHVLITLNGEEVFDDDVPVKDQHHVVTRELRLPEGTYTLRATSEDGATPIEATVDLDSEQWARARFAYATGGPPPRIDWRVEPYSIGID